MLFILCKVNLLNGWEIIIHILIIKHSIHAYMCKHPLLGSILHRHTK